MDNPLAAANVRTRLDTIPADSRNLAAGYRLTGSVARRVLSLLQRIFSEQRGYLVALTERVLGAVFEVSNTLGAGFLEKVYQRALLHELRLRGMRAAAEVSFPVTDKGHGVGEYWADLLVEDVLVIEWKCAERLSNEHTAQCLNYLRASGRTVCWLVTFQKPKVEWKRIVHRLQIPEPIEAPPLAG